MTIYPHMENDYRAWLRLWRGVLIKQVEDAFGEVVLPSGYKKGHDPEIMKKKIRDEAQDLLLRSKADFNLLCTLAGYEPDYVRRKLKEFHHRYKMSEIRFVPEKSNTGEATLLRILTNGREGS